MKLGEVEFRDRLDGAGVEFAIVTRWKGRDRPRSENRTYTDPEEARREMAALHAGYYPNAGYEGIGLEVRAVVWMTEKATENKAGAKKPKPTAIKTRILPIED